MRTVIDVPDEWIQSLDKVGDAEKCSRASLIREAIAEYLTKKATLPAEAAFGLWKTKPMEGVQYQENLRAEWEPR